MGQPWELTEWWIHYLTAADLEAADVVVGVCLICITCKDSEVEDAFLGEAEAEDHLVDVIVVYAVAIQDLLLALQSGVEGQGWVISVSLTQDYLKLAVAGVDHPGHSLWQAQAIGEEVGLDYWQVNELVQRHCVGQQLPVVVVWEVHVYVVLWISQEEELIQLIAEVTRGLGDIISARARDVAGSPVAVHKPPLAIHMHHCPGVAEPAVGEWQPWLVTH